MPGQPYGLRGYGTAAPFGDDVPLKAPLGFARAERRRLNILPICLNIFAPWILFCAIYAVMSFSIHYHSPQLAILACLLAGLVVLIALLLAIGAYKKKQQGMLNGDPTWYIFAFLSLFVGWSLAIVFGDLNFWYNMQPFYDVQNLSAYPSVNPAKEKGQQLMDAGRLYFAEGAALDFKRAMGFKNLDLYCVAPVVIGSEPLTSYDFWAVGLNCCSGVSSEFRCGEFNNGQARSGLRLMRDEQRPFFRLAVQQAEAAYNIKATHPIFFYWTQDPVAELNSYRDDGFKYYLLGVFVHFAFNTFCVVCAVFGFAKLGR